MKIINVKRRKPSRSIQDLEIIKINTPTDCEKCIHYISNVWWPIPSHRIGDCYQDLETHNGCCKQFKHKNGGIDKCPVCGSEKFTIVPREYTYKPRGILFYSTSYFCCSKCDYLHVITRDSPKEYWNWVQSREDHDFCRKISRKLNKIWKGRS